MSDQPEALRLADILQHRFPSVECLEKAAAELRRLHAECDALRVPCRTLVSLLETDDWQATLRLAVEQARAALKEAK